MRNSKTVNYLLIIILLGLLVSPQLNADTFALNRAYIKVVDVDFYERGVLFSSEETTFTGGTLIGPYLKEQIFDRNGTDEFVRYLQGEQYMDGSDFSTHYEVYYLKFIVPGDSSQLAVTDLFEVKVIHPYGSYTSHPSIEAYDINDTLLGSVSALDPASVGDIYQTLTLNFPGIHKIRFIPGVYGDPGNPYREEPNRFFNFFYNTPQAVAANPVSADAGVDQIVTGNDDVALDGSSSSSTAGNIIVYRWRRLPELKIIARTPTPTVIIKATGRVEEVVELKVTDESGNIGVDVMRLFNTEVHGLILNIQDPTPPIGDLNGDGITDILWQDSQTGEIQIGQLQASGELEPILLTRTLPTYYSVRFIDDLNGDGFDDVILKDTLTGDIYVWLMQGLSILAEGRPEELLLYNLDMEAIYNVNWYKQNYVLLKDNSTGEIQLYLEDTNNLPTILLEISCPEAESMIITENPDFSGLNWETFSGQKNFILSSGLGTKVVRAKFQNNQGQEQEVPPVSISIMNQNPIDLLSA